MVLRSGSWHSDANRLRVSFRSLNGSDDEYDDVEESDDEEDDEENDYS